MTAVSQHQRVQATFLLVMGLLAGCATNYAPDQKDITAAASLQQAQDDVKQAFFANRMGISDVLFIGNVMTLAYANGGQRRMPVSNLHPHMHGWWFVDVFIPLGHCWVDIANLGFETSPNDSMDTGCTQQDHQLVYALARLEKTQTPDVVVKERFADAVNDYREANPKPAISEDVRKFDVMASAALREKRLADAAHAYEEALDIAPWWPQGQFNVALVLGELTYYDAAIDHMQKYLALVPDAPDARAAQDKIYVWQGKQAAGGQ